MDIPSIRKFPESISWNPARALRRVVLPHPLGPSRVKKAPLVISSETLFKAWKLPYFLTAASTSTCDKEQTRRKRDY
jgi:hypothetical protein